MAQTRPATPLVTAFERSVREHEQSVAVSDDTVRLTYGDLDAASRGLADALAEAGVVPGARVGLVVDRSVDIAIGILGVLRSGASYVPLPADLPAARLEAMVEDAAVAVVATSPGLDGSRHGRPVVTISRDRRPRGVSAPSEPTRVVTGSDEPPADEAYVMFTSGTTGRPKGVSVGQQSVASLLQAARDVVDFGPGDVWALTHSYAFDFSVWELWGALASGGHVTVLGAEVVRSPESLWRACLDRGVTILSQTPMSFARLAAWASREETVAGALRYVVFGGERLEVGQLVSWTDRFGLDSPRLVNMYGITEGTVHATAHVLDAADLERGSVPIGHPLGHVSVTLESADGVVSPGETGEIVLRGSGVANGYVTGDEGGFRRSWGDRPGERVFRTGDYARLRQDGLLHYEGRRDDRVKVRGYRIELGDVEAAAAKHAGVRQAAAVVHDGDPPAIGCFVVADPGVDVLAVLATTREFLPPHAVPAHVTLVDDLPLTAHGKVDRVALSAVAPAPSDRADTAAAVETPEPLEPPSVEAPVGEPPGVRNDVLRECWRETLGLEADTDDDDFFSLGGDSIKVMRLVSTLVDAGVDVSIEDVYRNPVLSALESLVAGRTAAGAPRRAPDSGSIARLALVGAADRALVPSTVEDVYPLTTLQLGMVFEELRDDSLPYHNVTSTVVRARFEEARFTRALEMLADRHEVLRTSFTLGRYSVPAQEVHRDVTIPLVVSDVRDLPVDEQDRTIQACFDAECVRPFDHEHPPLIRFQVFVTGDDQFTLVTAEHHGILDGWSSALLTRELLTAGTDSGLELETPGVLPRFADHVAAEAHHLTSETLRQEWTDALDGLSPPLLRPLVQGGAAGSETVSTPLPPGTRARLTDAARRAGVQLPTYLVSVHAALYAELTGAGHDVVVGVVRHLRPERSGGDGVLGLFLNTVPLRVAPGRLTDVVARVAEQEREVLGRQAYPQTAIQALHPDLSVDNLFNLTDFHTLTPLLDADIVRHDEMKFSVTTTLPLLVEIVTNPLSGELELWMQFRRDYFTGSDIARWFERYQGVLGGDGPEPLPAPAVATGARDDDRWESVVARIRAWADADPTRIAVETPTDRLDYAGLMARADALAARIEGAGRAGPVGVLTDDLVEAATTMIATLILGRPVVPLDVEHPPGRQRLVLDLADVRVLLVGRQPTWTVPEEVTVLSLDDATAASVDSPGASPGAEPDQHGTAYVLFTSGSTGTPKGVRVSRLNLAATLDGIAGRMGIDETRTVLAWTSPAFDICFVELLLPLMVGARFVTSTRADLRDPGLVLDLIRDHGVDVVQGTPSKLQVLVDAGWSGTGLMLSGGEFLPTALATHLLRGGALFNGWGPTETTIYATLHRVVPEDELEVPIGTPLPGVEMWAVPVADGQPGQVEAVGEIFVGGVGVALGYQGRANLDGPFFVDASGRRSYRTGDHGVRRSDGAWLFRGRSDDQVKVNGMRIELGEVRAVVAAHADVRAAEVIAVGAGANRRLRAFVLPRGDSLDVAAVQQHVADRFPVALVPEIVALDEFPLTVSGKVDAAALAEVNGTAPANESDVAGATGGGGPRLSTTDLPELEGLITDAWSVVVRARPGLDDNFYHVGGDSLAVMRLTAILQRADLPISLQDLLVSQTVRDQAALVRDRQPEWSSTAGAGPGSPSRGTSPSTAE